MLLKRDNIVHLSFSFLTLWLVLVSRLAPGWCCLYHPPAVVGTEVAFQVNAHLAVQGGIDERVVACWAHGHEVTADLEDVDVPLADHVEVWVQVQQQVQNLDSNMEEPGSQPCLECFYFFYSLLVLRCSTWVDQEHSLISVKPPHCWIKSDLKLLRIYIFHPNVCEPVLMWKILGGQGVKKSAP